MKFVLKTKCFALKSLFESSLLLVALINFGMMSCNFSGQSTDKLPIIGERLGFKSNGDTLYPTVPSFSFINQDSQVVTNKDFDNKIYVVDFFFTHCPTICPKVTANMLRIYEHFKDSSTVSLLSHSIDTKYDTVGRLKDYADRMGVKAPKWHFITGNQDSIYQIADKYYLVIPSVDASIPGGFNHDGRLVLVDKQKRVRSFCDGTDAKDVDRFMKDIETLLKER